MASIQLLPHTYIHLQVEGIYIIFGKRHETGCSEIHLVIFGLSQRHLQHHHAHTLINTNTSHTINNHTLYSDDIVSLVSTYIVSITILVSLYHLPESLTNQTLLESLTNEAIILC